MNYAVLVRFIMPGLGEHGSSQQSQGTQKYQSISTRTGHKGSATGSAGCGIISLTSQEEDDCARPRQSTRQSLGPTPPPRPQPAPGRGRRPRLQRRQPLFRCPGPGAGEVRNAAAGTRGRPGREPGERHLRLFPSFVLRSPGCLFPVRPARPGPPTPRAQAGAQALRAGPGRARSGPGGPAQPQQPRPGPYRGRALRSSGPPPQRRAGIAETGKRGPAQLS